MNSEAPSHGFHDRLSELIGSEEPFGWAKQVGIPSSTFARVWTEKTIPKSEHLCRIAEFSGVTLDWLIAGKGPMRIDESPPAPAAPPAQAIDHALFGAVYAAVAALYREEKARISDNDLGALAAEKYEEIAASTTDPGDRRKMIALIVTQLRKDLRAGVGTTAQGKRSA